MTRPPIPVLRTPAAGDVVPLDAVAFRWEAPPAGASTYQLQVATDETFAQPTLDVTDLTTTELDLSDGLPVGALWWRVRADGGAWSRPVAFTSGRPADVEVVHRVEAVQAREARLAERDAKRRARTAPAATEAPPEPVWPHATGPALDPAAPAVDWSAVPGFGPPDRSDEAAGSTAAGATAAGATAPVPTGPLGGEVVDASAASFHWRGVAGATGYDVEVSPDSAFERDVLTLATGTATEVALQGVLPPAGARLHWRVRARTATGSTPWSRYGRFYPADPDTAEGFQTRLAAAREAQRRRDQYALRATERDLDQVPYYQRDGGETSLAEVGIVFLMMGSGIAFGLALLVVELLMG